MTEEIKKTTITKFKPNGMRFLVSSIKEAEKKTAGGIIITNDKIHTMSKLVTIVEIGNGFSEEGLEILGFKVGDKLEVVNRVMEEITLDFEKYNLVHNDHVLGKYSEVEA